MGKIKVLVVEDEWVVSDEIKEILQKNHFEVVGQADNAKTALEIAQKNPPDLALLDINIKGEKDGIELAGELKNLLKLGVVFLTAYTDSESLSRAKLVKPQSYLEKPFRETNVIMALELAFQNLSDLQNEESAKSDDQNIFALDDRLFIKESTRFSRLMLDDIHYIHADGSYCEIVTRLGNHTMSCNLKRMKQALIKPNFVRVHRSFIINLNEVEAIEGNSVFLNGKRIPVSQSGKEELTRNFNMF